MRLAVPAPLAVTFVLAAGGLAACAPSADLRVPLPPEAPARSRLALVVLGAPSLATVADTATASPFWADLRAALRERYALASVEYVAAPADSAFATRTVLAERPPLGAARQGWGRLDLRLAIDPTALAPDADVVVVLDSVVAYEGRMRPASIVGGLIGVGPMRPYGAGLTVEADVTAYRRGDAAPSGAGRVSVFGRGSGFLEARTDDASVTRAAAGVARQVGALAGLPRR